MWGSKKSAAAAGAADYFVHSFRRGRPSQTGGISMRLSILAFCMMLSAIPTAFALDCADETQVAMDICADASYQNADAALNRSYKEIIRGLKGDATTTKLLVEAQKAWIAYRDAECAFSTSANEGGTIHPMVFSICLEGVTKKRTAELSAYLKCAEGDTGCLVPAP
jgi:uncharacterized protein YecT (DUF1311 family)